MREVKVGIIGYGGIAKAHMRAYKKFSEEGTPIKPVATAFSSCKIFIIASDFLCRQKKHQHQDERHWKQ